MIQKSQTPVGRFLKHFEHPEKIAQEVKDQLYIKIYSSQMAAMRRKAYEDQALWVRDRTQFIDDRVDYAIQLFDMCSTFLDPGEDIHAGNAIALMNEYIGNVWVPYQMYLEHGNRLYESAFANIVPGGYANKIFGASRVERLEVVTYVAEQDIIPRLMTLCAKSFKARDNDHNWTTAIQAPPIMPPIYDPYRPPIDAKTAANLSSQRRPIDY